MFQNIALIGASGTIGNALLKQLQIIHPTTHIYAFSRTPLLCDSPYVTWHKIDYTDENSLAESARIASAHGPLDLVLCTTGFLHDTFTTPEKSLKDLNIDAMHKVFEMNAIIPALVAKHFIPLLFKDRRAIFASLSARVGSISENNLGGWYAYRASKAALNMIIKNLAIESARLHKDTIIVALHPGTVDTKLSAPYQKYIDKNHIFTPQQAAMHLIEVIHQLETKDTGKILSWDATEILP